MANYIFEYLDGMSKPSKPIIADNDVEARKERDKFLAEKPGRTYVPGSLTMTEHRHVLDEEQPVEKSPYPFDKSHDYGLGYSMDLGSWVHE